MGIFNFFKKESANSDKNPEPELSVKLQGPKYLREHLTTVTSDIVGNFKINYPNIQWIGQLISSTKNRLFQIKYYGTLMNDETIIDSEKDLLRIIIEDTASGEEILLFDKMFHGWDAFICNTYADQKNIRRESPNLYKPKNKFQIVVLAFYNESTKQELIESSTTIGTIELENGLTLNLQDAFDDAFDAILIYAIDEQGNKFQIVNEELA